MLGVADAGGGFGIALAGIEDGAGIGAIPEVDAEMVGGGVERVLGDDVFEEGVYGGALSVGAVGGFVELLGEDELGLDVVGIVEDDLLEGGFVFGLFVLGYFFVVEDLEGVDESLLSGGRSVSAFVGEL